MLLRIQPALTVTPFVQPLTLPSAPPAPRTNCTVMGWGTTTSPEVTYPDTPQCVNVTVVSNSRCQEVYGSKVTENMLCAGVAAGGKDSCQCVPMSYNHISVSHPHVPMSYNHI
uniref:Peptidase S1 domain-containing protein n=1 Tax=Anas platyrhynchos platyrhynchos TaxID=8840 RepID=A0A493TCQ2_ANAPP